MRFKLGLTGSIGMGKSTTAKMFQEFGCALWDADAAVHRLYSAGGAAVDPIKDAFPSAILDGGVSRDVLKTLLSEDPSALKTLESIVHPLVQQDRASFVTQNADKIGVFDIPLLFETGGDKEMDAVACVSVSPQIQRDRVLARGTMSEDTFAQIRARQMPNEDKVKRSTYVIETDTLDHAREQVAAVVQDIERRLRDA